MSETKKKLVCGVGVNDSISAIKGKGWSCPFYQRWRQMLNRCYSEAYQVRFPSYKGCSVCYEWLTFSNFKLWMKKQDWKGKQLDKDILNKGNKVYSPSKCIFIPQELNKLLTDRKANRGKYPIGVHKIGVNYRASCKKNGKAINIGAFSTAKEAFIAYKDFKLKLIRSIAEKQDEPLKSALLRVKIDP